MSEPTEISYQSFNKKRSLWRKKLQRNLEYQILRLGAFLGRNLPFHTLQNLGKGLGWLAYRVLKKERSIIEQQLGWVFPDISLQQRDQWTRECFLHFGRLLFEILGMDHLEAEAHQRFVVHGAELLKEGKDAGKGTIVLGLHLGNWEALVPYLMTTEYIAKVAVTPLYDERLNDFFVQLRQRGNIQLIQRGRPEAVRAILKCFKQNEIFFVLIDQDTDVSSMFVPFFGRPAQTPIVASNLALKTGATVLSAAVARREDGRFDVHLERVGQFYVSSPTQRDIYEVTLKFNQHIEQLIRRYPAQWAWFHRRWRHRPTEADLELLEEMQRETSQKEL